MNFVTTSKSSDISDFRLRNRLYRFGFTFSTVSLGKTKGLMLMQKHMYLLIALSLSILCCLMTGCSSAPESEAERQARWAQGNLNSWEVTNGIGPFTKELAVAPLDQSKEERGKHLFVEKCASCHTLDFKKTGPPLRDVSKRRSEYYVLNQILNPEQMGKFHPEGKKLVAQYSLYMTIQGITRDDAIALLDFLRSQANQPPAPMEKQPGAVAQSHLEAASDPSEQNEH